MQRRWASSTPRACCTTPRRKAKGNASRRLALLVQQVQLICVAPPRSVPCCRGNADAARVPNSRLVAAPIGVPIRPSPVAAAMLMVLGGCRLHRGRLNSLFQVLVNKSDHCCICSTMFAIPDLHRLLVTD
jgi:hypothetical protein